MFNIHGVEINVAALVVFVVFLTAALVAKLTHRHPYELRDLQLKIRQLEEERRRREDSDR